MKRLAAVMTLILVVAACSDDAESVFTSGDSTTTLAEAAPTTAAPTTTLAEAAPTTAAPTTTMAEAATTTAAPTTTAPPAPSLEFRPDGLEIAAFGDNDDAVVAAMTVLFGPPMSDTGWIEEPLCPGPLNRFVDFGVEKFDLRVLFTTGDLFAPEGTPHFYSYSYGGLTPVPVEAPNLTVGTTVAQLKALHPTVTFGESPFVLGQIVYSVDGLPGNQALSGGVSGTGADTDVVQSIQGGIGCGE